MSTACRADITDRSYTWQNPNDITRILSVGEVRIMLIEEFNGHELYCIFSVYILIHVKAPFLGVTGKMALPLIVGNLSKPASTKAQNKNGN